MRIAVIGAGGVGGYFGGRLAADGHDVVFVQRGAHLDAMRDSGLRVTSALGDIVLDSVHATDNPDAIGPVDIVLIAVKSGGTEEAGWAARTMLGPETGVISLQNGVENEDRLVPIVGTDHVMGGVAYILSLIEEPGHVAHKGPFARLIFGERDGARSARAGAFLTACLNAGIDAELSENIEQALWVKFVGLCPHNGMTALTRAPIGAVRTDSHCRALLEQATLEAIAVAHASGIVLPADFTDSPMLVHDEKPPNMTSSMHYDITHGKPLELEWLNGAVIRLGRQLTVATPVNAFIYAALKLSMNGPPMELDGA